MKILAAIVLFSLSVSAELVPVGFHSLDSKKIPADLRAILSKVQGSVGKVELRVNKDVSKEVKKGAVYTSGTGYVVEPGDVLRTASHVIKAWKENRDKLDLFFVPDGKEGILIEKIIKDDADTDLATLEIKKQENFLALSNQKLELGTPLIQIGYALGFENKKMTYGQIIKKSKRGFILSSPSVPGCSGGPLLTLEGDKVAVAGQLFGHESIFTIPEFKESLDLDYDALSKLNINIHRLTTLANLDILKLTKNEKGEYQSAFIDEMLRPDYAPVKVAYWNYRLYRSDHNLKEAIKVLSELKELVKLDSTGKYATTTQDILNKLSGSMATKVKVIYELPILSGADVKNFDSKKLVAKLETAIQQLEVRNKEDLKKIDFFESTDCVAKYLLELKKDPKKLQSDEHLNDHFFFTPALIVPLVR